MKPSPRDLFAPKYDKKNALALGGGGLWGIAHIGVLKFLQEKKIPVHAIAGASMGAIVGVIAAAFIGKDGVITSDGIAYMERVVKNVRCYADFTETVQEGEKSVTRLALHKLLLAGGRDEYEHMMSNGPAVHCYAQVAKHTERGTQHELFMGAVPEDDDMHLMLRFAQAAAANHKMFGLDPELIDDVEYSDDTSIWKRSISACVRQLRKEFADIRVIGSAVSFVDGGPWIRGIANALTLWKYSDLGDVTAFPKYGRQPHNGSSSLTNWSQGSVFPFMGGQSFARDEDDLKRGDRIAIPVQGYIDAGYDSAKREEEALTALKE